MSASKRMVEQLNLTFRVEEPEPQRTASLGRWITWCLVGCVVAVVCWTGGRFYLASSLTDNLAGAAERDEALFALQQLILLDEEANGRIVRGLEHTDMQVARATYRVLDARITQWQQSPETCDHRLLELARLLHELPVELKAENQMLASGLAMRIEAYVSPSSEPDLVEALKLCQIVQQRAGQRQAAANVTGVANLEATESPAVDSRALASNTVDRGQANDGNAIPNGGHLAQPPSDSPTAADPNSSFQLSDRDGVTETAATVASPLVPRLAATGAVQASTGSPVARMQLVAGPTQTRSAVSEVLAGEHQTENSLRVPTSGGSSREATLVSVQQSVHLQEPLPNIDPPKTIELAQIPALDEERLVRLLSSIEPQVAQTAALALRSRGWPDHLLALASELATCSTQRRVELTKELASRNDLEPRVWLLWMAENVEPEVRLHAVSLLGSMADRSVRRALRSLLPHEQDSDVAEAIRRVLATGP